MSNNSNNFSSLLDEISSLSKNDIGNFMIHNTKFSEILEETSTFKSRTDSNADLELNASVKDLNNEHIRNKTTFNFDFNKGTFKTHLLGIEEKSEEKDNDDSIKEKDDNNEKGYNNNNGSSNDKSTNSPNEENAKPNNNNNNFNVSNLDNNDSIRISKYTMNIAVSNTKIDFINTILRTFYNIPFTNNATNGILNINIKSIPSIPSIQENYEKSIEKLELSNLKREFTLNDDSVISLTAFHYKIEEESKIGDKVNDINYIIAGTQKGNIIIAAAFNSKSEFKTKIIQNPFESKIKGPITNSLKALSYKNGYLICGYSNGGIAIYSLDLKGNIKKVDLCKNFTTNAIIEIKQFDVDAKKTIGFYFIDVSGSVYRCIIKIGVFKNKGDYNEILSNKDNPYYSISVLKENNKIITIGNLDGIRVFEVQDDNTVYPLLSIDIKSDSSSFILPTFFFGINQTLYISIDNSISIYKIEEGNIVNQKGSISYENPIIFIGLFNESLVFVIDSEMRISFVNYEQNQYINSICHVNTSNLFTTKNVYHQKMQKYISSFHNSIVCAEKSNCIFIYETNEWHSIRNLKLENYIEYILDSMANSGAKWRLVFQILTQIYKKTHPFYKISKEHFNILFHTISNKFSVDTFTPTRDSKFEDYNKNIQVCFEYFINFLFDIDKVSYITTELLILFSSLNKLPMFFNFLEPYILNNKLSDRSISIEFIVSLITTYSNENKKQILSNLLLHFSIEILVSDETIYSKLISNKLYSLLFFVTLHNQTRSYLKPIEITLNELTYLVHDNSNDDNDFPPDNFDFFSDKCVFTKTFIQLQILWYVNELIDKNGSLVINDNHSDGIVSIFLNEHNFSIFCVENNLIPEYFYSIKKIVDNCDNNAKVRKNFISTYNTYTKKHSQTKNITLILFHYYLLVIHISANYFSVDLSNDLKIKAILFLLTYQPNISKSNLVNENEVVFDNICDDLGGSNNENNNELNEENLITVIKGLDSITNDDSAALLKACENTSCLIVKNYIKNLFQM